MDERLSCKTVMDRAGEYLDEASPPSERELVERHLAACVDCARFFQEIRQTVRALRSLPREPMPPALKERLRQALHDRQSA